METRSKRIGQARYPYLWEVSQNFQKIVFADTRSCPLDRTASMSLYYNPSLSPSWLLGGALRLSSLLTPERTVAHTTHLGVSPHLPSHEEIYLLRDYRPTLLDTKVTRVTGNFRSAVPLRRIPRRSNRDASSVRPGLGRQGHLGVFKFLAVFRFSQCALYHQRSPTCNPPSPPGLQHEHVLL